MSFLFFSTAGLHRTAVFVGALWLPFYLSAQNAVPDVRFSAVGGLYAGPIQVTLSNPLPSAALYYTLDGSEPDINALHYSTPLAIPATTVLRVRAFVPGLKPSALATQSYFMAIQHNFPVVSLVFPPGAFFDSLTGIYTNYTNELSVVSNLEFFEPTRDSAVVNQLVEVEIQGSGSISLPQKSLEIKAKKSLGRGEINYPLFRELPYDSYKRLVLRNGGQDWCVLQFRDEFATSLVGDLSDLGGLLMPPQLFLQAWRPAVVYLNGKYWGIHNVRERMTQFYVRQHKGWSDTEYDLIENFDEVLVGDADSWRQFVNFLKYNDFSSDAQLEELKQQIDYQNYLDYCAYNIYLGNEDWPGNNVRRFRHRGPNGKWQWMTYDLDFTFGLYQANGGWNTGSALPNALGRLLDSTAVNWPNPNWSTLLFRRCWQNATFQRDFANRMADMLNTNLLPQRVNKRLGEFQQLYEPEIDNHYQRWWTFYIPQIWYDNIAKTRSFAEHRPDRVRKEIQNALPNPIGLAPLTVDVYPSQGGAITVSTVHPDSTNLPWSGTYFRGLEVPIKATAYPGFHFDHWSDPNLGTADSLHILLDTIGLLVAYFEPDPVEDSALERDNRLEINLLFNQAIGTLVINSALIKDNGFQVQIVDVLGRVMQERLYPAQAEGILSLETGDLIPGTYFLRVTLASNGLTGTRGFVKT